MIKITCPNCEKTIETTTGIQQKCSYCKKEFIKCNKTDCNYIWIPRKKIPKECPYCKRYL